MTVLSKCHTWKGSVSISVSHSLIGQFLTPENFIGWRFLRTNILADFFSVPCPDKTSGDKTSRDKTSVDKTSVGTKRPWGQNIRSDKTSVGRNIRGDKMSVGHNVRQTKRPWGQNVREQNISLGHIYHGLARQFLLIKIYWAWRKNPPIPTLSLCGRVGGSMYSTYHHREVLYIYQKIVYILKLPFSVGDFSKSYMDKRG